MDTVVFFPDGIWIYPSEKEGFKFNGSVIEFLSILVYHTELDIKNAQFLVRGSDTLDNQ